MYYGVPEAVTYIIEEMGGGCAFFDYDNDGWMDIFILGGRTLEAFLPMHRIGYTRTIATVHSKTSPRKLDCGMPAGLSAFA